jgi:hypothetical protein
VRYGQPSVVLSFPFVHGAGKDRSLRAKISLVASSGRHQVEGLIVPLAPRAGAAVCRIQAELPEFSVEMGAL